MSSSHNFTTSFIELYRAQPCLWQVKSKAYRDHKLKTQAYEELVALAKPHFPGIKCDIDFVKTEIKSMCTVFKKEWEKVRNTTRSGASSSDIYKPKLWYYDLLTFTVDQNELRPMQAPEEEDANLAEAPGTSQGLENTPEDDDAVAGPSHMSPRIEGEPSQGEATDGESYPRVAPTRPAKRSHKSHNTTSDDILEVATSFLTSRMEPCPAMCHLLRQRQHKISDDQMRHLDRVIHQVIDAAQMGELGEESQWPRASPAPPAETPRSAPIRRQRRGPKSRDTRTKPRS